MIYEVRKDGQVYMKTSDEQCRYSPVIEAAMKEAGYSIYIDGKPLKKTTSKSGGRRSSK